MGGALARLGPMVAVAGLAGYCLLPTAEPNPHTAAAGKAGKEELPRIEPGLLSPAPEPALARNPFEPTPPPAADAGGRPRAGATVPALPEGLVLGATLVHGRRRAAIINGRVYSEGEAVAAASPGPAGASPPGGSPPAPRAAATPPGPAPSGIRPVLERVEHDRVWLRMAGPDGEGGTVALAYARRRPLAARQAAAAASPAPEPGSAEHLAAVAGTDPAQMQAFLTIARGLLGRGAAAWPAPAPATPAGRRPGGMR